MKKRISVAMVIGVILVFIGIFLHLPMVEQDLVNVFNTGAMWMVWFAHYRGIIIIGSLFLAVGALCFGLKDGKAASRNNGIRMLAIIVPIINIVFLLLRIVIRSEIYKVISIVIANITPIAVVGLLVYCLAKGQTKIEVKEQKNMRILGCILLGIFGLITTIAFFGGNGTNAIIGIMVGVIIILSLSLLMVLDVQKKFTAMYEKIINTERTPEQQEMFLNSQAYEKMTKEVRKNMNRLWLCVGLSTSIAFLVGFVIIFFYWRAIKKAKKAEQLLEVVDCVKCGSIGEIVSTKYLRTEVKHEERKDSMLGMPNNKAGGYFPMGSYRPEGEIVNTRTGYTDGSNPKPIAVHTMKFTQHWHEIKRNCPECGHEWTWEECLPIIENGKEKVVMNIEHFHEAKKEFPPVYCSHCGGKNKGEAIKCEGCGSALLKPKT